jgi:nucleoid DNA-binding protein
MVAKKKTASSKSVKKTAKKPVAKKSTAAAKSKKTSSKAKSSSRRLPKIETAYTRTELYAELAEKTELPKKTVVNFLSELEIIMAAHLKKGGPETFALPGMFKVSVKKVAAKKARKGINPFTGEKTTFKAKPASKRVKIKPLEKIKSMVA